MFDISELLIHCHKGSFFKYITGGVNMRLYECVSLLAPECAVSLCMCMYVFVCVISNQSTSKKPNYVLGISKRDALLHETHSKAFLVLRYQVSTCVDR